MITAEEKARLFRVHHSVKRRRTASNGSEGSPRVGKFSPPKSRREWESTPALLKKYRKLFNILDERELILGKIYGIGKFPRPRFKALRKETLPGFLKRANNYLSDTHRMIHIPS